MVKLRPPPPYSFEGNVSEGWKIWQKHFQFFLTATESDTKSDKIKTSILLTCIGPKGRDIYETFTFEQDTDKLKLKPVLEKFTMYCNPRKNITILRHKFFTYKQAEGQCFNDFVTELKKRSSECEFGDLTASLTKDMIVCGKRITHFVNAFFVMPISPWKKQLLLVTQQKKQNAMPKSSKNTKNQLMFTKSTVVGISYQEVLISDPSTQIM